MISQPKIERPAYFGSREYFSRDQHCESPNPDLLAKHGMSMKTIGSDAVVFHHVVEREYMIRMCPCVMSHCNCDNVSPGTQFCSRIYKVILNKDKGRLGSNSPFTKLYTISIS